MNTQFLERSEMRGEGRIAYDVTGAGPLVICVPGMGDLRQQYRFLAPQLVEAGYSVATMDLRGMGESSVGWSDYSVAGVGSDMVALAGHLDMGPAILIGGSMAAGAAVWAAAEHPDAFSGLVLIGPFVRDFPSFMEKLYPLMFADLWGPAVWGIYYRSLYPSRKPADFAAYVAGLKANLRRPGRMDVLRRMLAASKAASEARLAQIDPAKTPALVVMGTRDPDFKDPAAEARWAAERLGAQFRMIEGAGHYPHTEIPAETGALVLSFLEQSRQFSRGVAAPAGAPSTRQEHGA